MPKQLYYLIGAGIVVVVFGGVLFYAQPQNEHAGMNVAPTGEKLDLNLDPAQYDFGTISMKNGKVTKSFQVKNNQGNDVKLSMLYTSCMCTEAKFIIGGQQFGPFSMQGHGATKMLNQKLKAGQEAEIQVTFDPNAHGPSGIGVIERTVSLQSDDGKVASVDIKANVIP